MRYTHIAITSLIVLVGCASGDCLPEPQRDTTPPELRVIAYYTAPGSRTETSRTVTILDTTDVVPASRTAPVRIEFIAADSSGLRRLTPAVTIQQTVGIGVERQIAPVNSVTSSCPVGSMRTTYEAHTSGKPRVLIVSAVAENWVGGRSIIEPLSIRLQ